VSVLAHLAAADVSRNSESDLQGQHGTAIAARDVDQEIERYAVGKGREGKWKTPLLLVINNQSPTVTFYVTSGGMYLQGITATLAVLICLLALCVPSIINYSIVPFHIIIVMAAIHAYLQFIVFGGLSAGRYAHASYYKEPETNVGASSVYNDTNTKSGGDPADVDSDKPSDFVMTPRQQDTATEAGVAPTMSNNSSSTDITVHVAESSGSVVH
jgi:hypothetical protein